MRARSHYREIRLGLLGAAAVTFGQEEAQAGGSRSHADGGTAYAAAAMRTAQTPDRGRAVAWLTKSRFLSGIQCAKRLWFEVHEPLEESGGNSMPLVNGRAFDEVVQTLEPGLVIPRTGGLPKALDETRDAFSQGSPPVLYQGAFRDGPLAVIVDILRAKDSAFELVEVKPPLRSRMSICSMWAFRRWCSSRLAFRSREYISGT